ncbi:GNAT family N-acetyltransferase [Streptomyces mangrovisoli]|uniref:GNAT family N-acetyltransferase n=1 Tax=Streptomyces mangrovisoli TaxID=1428628 RepID=A0A1J4NZJ5_9ACTN|nr:GNAT family N-acetyltransferase [Streptomyces mangrovisoli]OIJ67911.1 GNAT family N-acetyltransferase [Streptomyces mangrovisoli]
MTLADCDRVAEIRVAGWRTAYRGLMPQPYLDGLSVARDAERRREVFTRDRTDVVNLVAEHGGEVAGWAAHGPYRDDESGLTADAELYTLYVDPARQGRGIGHALLQEVLRQRAGLGHDLIMLWVVKGNTPARRFYERAGFAADGAEEPFEAGGASVPEVRYVRHLGPGA